MTISCTPEVPTTERPTEQPTMKPTFTPTMAPTAICGGLVISGTTGFNGHYKKQMNPVNSHDWWQSRNDVNNGLSVSLFFDKDHWKLAADSGSVVAYQAPVLTSDTRRPFNTDNSMFLWTEIRPEVGTDSGVREGVTVQITCTNTMIPTELPTLTPTEEPTEQPTFGPTQIYGQIDIRGTKER